MNQPLIEIDRADVVILAARFRAMADRMELNGSEAFGGAFVVVPPKNGGEPIETLILDSQQQAAQFWVLLKTRCDLELARLDEAARNMQAFRR